jgi:hypothetical protein
MEELCHRHKTKAVMQLRGSDHDLWCILVAIDTSAHFSNNTLYGGVLLNSEQVILDFLLKAVRMDVLE